MPYSFHSHSGQFCHHGYGKLEQVVEEARRKGFRVYGLSEHMPRFGAESLYPEEIEAGCTTESLCTTFNDFIAEARRLQELYKNPQLLVGTEIEFINDSYAIHIDQLRSRVDYIVGSLHHVAGIPIDFSQALYDEALASTGGDLARLFEAYFDEQYEMLCRTKPDVIAHFDLIRIFAGNELKVDQVLKEPSVWKKVCRNVLSVIAFGGLFEINSRAWKKGLVDAYPQSAIVKFIKEQGGLFTLSDDCHGPRDVGMFYGKLREYLSKCGIDTIHYLVRENGKTVVKEHQHISQDIFWQQFED